MSGVWKASPAVIARYRRDDVTDRIMFDEHGLPEIVLVALPWNAGGW